MILASAVAETLICMGGPEWLYLVLMWIPAMAATECILSARPACWNMPSAWALAAVLYIRVKKQIQHLSFGHIQLQKVSICSGNTPVECFL